jgi:hypothetical protein
MLINAPGGTEVYVERLTESRPSPELVRGFEDRSNLPLRDVMLVLILRMWSAEYITELLPEREVLRYHAHRPAATGVVRAESDGLDSCDCVQQL